MKRVWRVWRFPVDDAQGYETAKDLGLKPFAVDDGWIYWRAFIPAVPPEESSWHELR